MTPINIAKVKTLRNGWPVHIYEILDNRIYGRYLAGSNHWMMTTWSINGSYCGVANNPCDLVEEKTWRSWKDGEGPRLLMVKWKGDPIQRVHAITCGKGSYSYDELFEKAIHVHEDGSESPCGVEE